MIFKMNTEMDVIFVDLSKGNGLKRGSDKIH